MRVAGLRLAAALLVAAGCGGGSDTTEAHIQLVVADRNIRREGVECAGARPFQHVRAGAPSRSRRRTAQSSSTASCPLGARATPSRTSTGGGTHSDLLRARLRLEVPQLACYRLHVGDSRPLEFRVGPRTDEPIELVVG